MSIVTKTLEKTMETLLDTWHVPGMSIALIENGEITFTKGYGVRDTEAALPMTEKTVLPIGSVTKSFTALAIGILADEGKLDFDTPVRKYIPWLKLYDAYTTEHVTVRDLLCHRTGVPRYDMQVALGAMDNKEAQIKTFQYLQPNKEFRTKLQYSNQMVSLAGYLVDVITGQTYESFVKERIFDKLGMTSSNFEVDSLKDYEDHAKGYVFTGEGYIEPPYLHLGALNPAGGIVSTAEDMANYVKFQLGDGTWNGERLISKKLLDEMHTEQMIGSPYFWKFDEVQTANYGLAWFTDTYRGRKMVSHGGNTNGFSAQVVLLPESGFAIAALSNGTSTFSVNAVANILADTVLGVPENEIPDWTERYQNVYNGMVGDMMKKMQDRAEAKIPDTVPSHPAEEYTGTFVHPGFGTIELSSGEENSLSGKWNSSAVMLNHYHYDSYDMLIPLMGAQLPGYFETGADGHISALLVEIESEPGILPARFEKK